MSAPDAGVKTRSVIRDQAGRFISFAGFLLLCISFFLPHVKGCDEPVIPAEYVVEGRGDGLFLPFYWAFFMLLVYVLRWLLRKERARRLLVLAGCVVTILGGGVASLLLGCLVLESLGTSQSDASDLSYVAWAFASCLTITALIVTVTASMVRKLPATLWLGGLGSFAYFLYFARWKNETCYGLWVSIAASAFIFAGALCEAGREHQVGSAGPPAA